MFDRSEMLLPEFMALHARYHPHKPALIGPAETLSWGDLDRAMDMTAAALQAVGVIRGDVVGVLGDLTPASVAAQYGVLRAGAVVASLPTTVTAADLTTMIADSGAKAVLVAASSRATATAARDAGGAVAGGCWFAIDFAAPGWAAIDGDAGPAPVTVTEDDLFCLIYSSGTTGTPKGIVLTHRCRFIYSLMLGAALGWTGEAVSAISTALHSNTSWSQLNRGFLVGGTAVLLPKFDAGALCAAIKRHRVTHSIMVPAQYQALLDHPAADAGTLASLRMACTVGSLMTPDRKRQLAARLPAGLYEVYGLTEGLVTILTPADIAGHAESVGRPMLGNDIRILGPDDREMPVGEAGEIVGYTPFLMRGYHNRPAETEAALWREPATGRTFLRSGDIGRIDGDGFVHLVDRKKDMIVSGGYNVYPADIERVLAAHPAVADVAVIGIPHERWGETPLGLVVLRPGAAISADDLTLWANGRLGRHQRLAGIELRDGLPRNPGGKILKRDLRQAYWPVS